MTDLACQVLERVDAGGRSAVWFHLTVDGHGCEVLALAAPELVKPLFIMHTGPQALETARGEFARAAESIVNMKPREPREHEPLSEPWDDETNFRGASGFDPTTEGWFRE